VNWSDCVARYYPEAVVWRRALHRCPQPAWLEFFATAFVAEKLADWGYELEMGADIIAANRQLLLPSADKLQSEYERAIRFGASEQYLAPAKGGFTGVVAVLRGRQPGPTVGFRFDIDSNEVTECADTTHRPARESFRSENPGYAHMCGHDAHTASGLLLARCLAENRDTLRGTVKLIFQPNEENLSGAAAMVEAGVLEDIDYLLGGHVGTSLTASGSIALNVHSFLALTRFEVIFAGRATHAGVRPDEGRNALLGACAAITHLHAIARHGLGPTRINVGTIEAGTTWNVVPDRAYFRMETRGATNEINDYMVRRSREVLEGAARMYGLDLEIKPAATAQGGSNSPELIRLGEEIAGALPWVESVVPEAGLNASEDVTLMMQRVQERGGKAMFVLLGTPTFGGHHSASFDLDERVIRNAAEFYAAMHDSISRG
jgi:aminobenzoyl-glutamate utilization protein A